MAPRLINPNIVYGMTLWSLLPSQPHLSLFSRALMLAFSRGDHTLSGGGIFFTAAAKQLEAQVSRVPIQTSKL